MKVKEFIEGIGEDITIDELFELLMTEDVIIKSVQIDTLRVLVDLFFDGEEYPLYFMKGDLIKATLVWIVKLSAYCKEDK